MSEKGQVLVEVLIGVTIMAVVIVAILQGFHVGIEGTQRVDERTAAANVAQSQMEYVKSQAYEEFDAGGNPVDGDGYSKLSQEDLPTGFSTGDIEIVVSNLGNETSPEEIQMVSVSVTYGTNNDTITLSDYNRNE